MITRRNIPARSDGDWFDSTLKEELSSAKNVSARCIADRNDCRMF